MKLEQVVPITVLVLNFNGKEILEQCLRSFVPQKVLPQKLIIVDNGSSIFDVNSIKKILGSRFEGVLEFIIHEKNLGYAKGMNKAIESVLSRSEVRDSSEWIMTLNNDTELSPNFFESLTIVLQGLEKIPSDYVPKSNSEKRFVGMLGPKILSMKNQLMLDATGISLCLDGMSTARGQREVDYKQYDDKVHILIPNGVSAIYHSQMLRDVGLMDESFWAYCEDTDLGLRAWLAGWECRFLPTCQLSHARSATQGEFSIEKLYYAERNHYWVVIKNFPFILICLNPIFSVYRYLMQVYAVLAKRGQGDAYGSTYPPAALFFATLKGVWHAFLGTPKAFFSRFSLRDKRRRKIKEILVTLWLQRLKFSDLILK